MRTARKTSVKLRYTRLAIIFFAIFVLVQVAAFNSGENLLYMVAAGVASFLILGLILTRGALSRLRITRDAPQTAHRREPFTVDVSIENRRLLLPVMSVLVGDTQSPDESKAYIPRIPAHTRATVRIEHSLPKRGVHTLAPLQLKSSFPLGLFVCRLIYRDGVQVTVYPRVYAVRQSMLEHLDDSGDLPRPLDLSGDEFFALREYVPGDDIRYICWRVSARVGRLIVREMEPSTARSIVVVLDPRGIPDTEELDEQFEEAIDLAASLVMTFLDKQFAVSVITPNESVGLGTGAPHARKIMEMLTRVDPVGYSLCSDDWFMASGDVSGAAKVYVATDPAQWGAQAFGRGVRILNPQEVTHA